MTSAEAATGKTSAAMAAALSNSLDMVSPLKILKNGVTPLLIDVTRETESEGALGEKASTIYVLFTYGRG
jgi:hypothetical protein